MGKRSVGLTLLLAVLAFGAGGACFWRMQVLEGEAAWLALRAGGEASEYAESFDGKRIDAQLKTFAARRLTLERAHLWERGVRVGVLAGALLLLAAYGLFLLRRLEEMRREAEGEAPVPYDRAEPPAPAAPQGPPALAHAAP